MTTLPGSESIHTTSRREFTATHIEIAAAADAQVLLAFDTSLGSVVAVNRGSEVWQFASADPLGHAEVIGELVQKTLRAAGFTAADVTGVVMGTGPGPFTGLRVGMAAATAFATARELPLLPLCSHLAAARDYFAAEPVAESVQIVQDARRKELFITDYARTATGFTVQEAPHVVKRADWQDPGNAYWPAEVNAAALLELAHARLRESTAFDSSEPLYLRAPDVRLPAGVKSVLTGLPAR